jgi:DNA-binding response OmpR family regulator
MGRVIIVEDDPILGLSLHVTLRAVGHEAILCPTLASARTAIAERSPDLVVLDLGLPDGDGLDLCRELRGAGSRAAVIVLTARGTLEARVLGFEVGADDYVSKPFELPELVARVEARMRRQRWNAPTALVTVGRLEVDFERRLAAVDGEAVTLTDLELRLLSYLYERAGYPVSRETLLRDVWDLDPSTRTRTVDVFVGRLRRLIERDTKKPKHLQNVRGHGYRLSLE